MFENKPRYACFRSFFQFAGRIYSGSKKTGVAGASVQLLDLKTKRIYASGITGRDGSYRIFLLRGKNSEIFRKSSALFAQVVDANNKILSKTKKFKPLLNRSKIINIRIAQTSMKDFKPIAHPIERTNGSLFNLQAINIIKSAISRIILPGQQGYNKYLRLAMSPFPKINKFPKILEDAWSVLDGDPRATLRLRQTLNIFMKKPSYSSPNSIQPKYLHQDEVRYANEDRTYLKNKYLGQAYSSSSTPLDFCLNYTDQKPEGPRLLVLSRFLPLVVATMKIARNREDSSRLMSALLQGLSGIRIMNLLVTTSHRVLQTGETEALKGLLEHIAIWCGPDDNPLPPFHELPEKEFVPMPPPDISDLFDDVRELSCLYATQAYYAALEEERENYCINEIVSRFACPGDSIVIKGSGFGDVPGKVCFPNNSITFSNQICVDPVSWSTTEVTAIVPEDAGPGMIWLTVLEDIFHTCVGTFELFKKGIWAGENDDQSGEVFSGGRPRFIFIGVNFWNSHMRPPILVNPNRDIIIWWDTLQNKGVKVRVQIKRGGLTYLDQSDLPGYSFIVFHTPNFSKTTDLKLSYTVEGACGSDTKVVDLRITKIPKLEIEGIEITQGIQRFWRNVTFLGVTGNWENRWGWNTVPTVANKDTIVRVYVSCDRDGFENDQIEITGYLQIGSSILTPINGITPTSPTGGNPIIIAQRKESIDRGVTDHTLNFRIPAALCTSTKTLKVRIWVPDTVHLCPMYSTSYQLQKTLSWTWRNNKALPVRYVRIRDNRTGSSGTGTRPTRDEALFTLQRLFDLLPSPATDIGPASSELHTTTRPFDTDAGIEDLLNDLDDIHDTAFMEVINGQVTYDFLTKWVGLTTPFNRGIANIPGYTSISCIHEIAQGQTAIERIKTAHEVSHNLDFKHVERCCFTPAPFNISCPSGPFYDHPNNGTLFDVPFDPFWNQTIDGSVQDYMSYACSRYVSANSWNRLIDKMYGF